MPQQIAALNILQMSHLELEERIKNEQSNNPLLELEPSNDTQTDISLIEEYQSADLPDMAKTEGEVTQFDANRNDFRENLEEDLEKKITDTAGSDEQKRHQFMIDSVTSEKTFYKDMMEQLEQSDCPEELYLLAENIIGSLSEKGYFEEDMQSYARKNGVSIDKLEAALAVVQSFEPPGVAAKDLKDCLLIQVKRNPRRYPQRLFELIQNHTDDIAHGKTETVREAMGITREELEELLTALKKLDPYPRKKDDSPGIIVFDILVQPDGNGGYLISVPNEFSFPALRVSKDYEDMLSSSETDPEVKKYLLEKKDSIRILQTGIDLRKKTLLQIANLIVSKQFHFFDEGEDALQSLTMSEVAEKIGRDISTVSKAVDGKYMKTPLGIIPFRKFFTSGGVCDKNGNDVSASKLKSLIRDAIMEENMYRPLSDSALVELLKGQGYDVARRTVAKYRESLGIPSSQERRKA